MAIRTTDPNTGAPRYSAVFLLTSAIVLCAVIGLTFHFMGNSPFKRKVPKIAHPYDGDRSSEMANGDVPTQVDKQQETQKFSHDYATGVGEAQVGPKSDTKAPEVTNSATRFDRELNAQRVNSLAATDATTDASAGPAVDAADAAGASPLTSAASAAAAGSQALQDSSGAVQAQRMRYPAIPGQFPDRPRNGGAVVDDVVAAIPWGAPSEAAPGSTTGGVGGPAGAALAATSAAGQPQDRGDTSSYVPADVIARRALFLSANSVPTGTHLSVRLMNNVRSNSAFKQRVWAITTQELIFRRQVQLPRGVLLAGSVGSTSQEQVDITFDLAVFPDGTELPLSGFGVCGNDPRYPDLVGMRGLQDEYIEPPLWHEFFPIILAGVSNYTNTALQTSQNSVILSSTGVPQTPSPSTQVNEAINGMVQRIQTDVLAYLSRYSPYVHLRRGYPFFVEVDSTVDFSRRRLNAQDYQKLLQILSQGGGATDPAMKSLPEFMHTTPDKAKADVAQAMSPQGLSASPLSVLAALQRAVQGGGATPGK